MIIHYDRILQILLMYTYVDTDVLMNLSVCLHLASTLISIPGKYFDYSNDEVEDDEEDFVKEKPTPAKHPKWYHIYYLILV